MCLILFAHRAHPAYPLVVAANRDEWFHRPTAPAGFWPDAPDVLAGRDLEASGTWMGITRSGRFAALTNYRDPARNHPGAPSRGLLVSRFLQGSAAPLDYLHELSRDAHRYNGFSLLAGDAGGLACYSNRDGGVRELAPGVYGLSNSLLDVPWPKVRTGKARLAAALGGPVSPEPLLAVLADTAVAEDAALPATGMSLEWERALSPLRILTAEYGTRASTVLLVGADGGVALVERSFGRDGGETGLVRERFALHPSPLVKGAAK